MLSAIRQSLHRVAGNYYNTSNYLLTGQCILCLGQGQSAVDLCSACAAALPRLETRCQQCALPLATSHLACGECLIRPPPFSYTAAPWCYQFPVAQLISAFKYQRKYSYGETLGRLMLQQLIANYAARPLPDSIAAVPLHWRRHWHRGFNQSELLANLYSRKLNIRRFYGLQRHRNTPNQQSLNAAQRKKNLHNAFQISQQRTIAGQCIALVDDVMTTGATAREISQTLLNAGAAEVHIWVLARTPH
ncbi:MAG: ComF family protein [Paraglaciecola psychrophila]|jgi:ComF family protein